MVRMDTARKGQVRYGQEGQSKERSSQVWSGGTQQGKVKSCMVRRDTARKGQVRYGQEGHSKERSSQVWLGGTQQVRVK